jgi:hypothetical protein
VKPRRAGDAPVAAISPARILHAKTPAKRVYVVEGEKDADNLVKLGLAATSNPGSAGKWCLIR